MNKKIIALTLLVVMSFVSIFSFSTLVKAENDIELAGTVATQSGSLNVRKSPSTSSSVIATLKKGSTITVIETDIASSNSSSTKWCKIEYGKITGYVSASYIDINEIQGHTTASSLKLRSKASTSSSVVTYLPKGTEVTISGKICTSDINYPVWLKIEAGKFTGYVSSLYVEIDSEVSTPTPEPNPKPTPEPSPEKPELDSNIQTYIAYTTASSLNVRTAPSTTSSKIESLRSYTLVRVLETVNTSNTTNPVWYKIQHNKNIGYVSATYIKLIKMEDLRAGKITTTALNLRSNPSTSSKVLDVLSENDIVSVFSMKETSDAYGSWYQVKSPEGKIGWVASKYLKLSTLTHISTATTKTYANENRDNNINIASNTIIGTVIRPGKTFSWRKIIGSCTAEEGYLPADTYVGDATVKGLGGGVCQVSTTINIAVKRTGIKTNATKHIRPVSYADREDEATVSYSSGIDFSFTNTLNKPIVLELVGGNGSCICNVYEVN